MIDILKPLIKQFLPFAQETMGFKDPPRLFLRSDAKNAENPLGKTAYYDPSAKSVTLYIQNRHPKDIMRSLSHELVHHTQNCNGQFENVGEMGEGYAQNNDHLREMERQAYEIGNLCFRDWEDSVKSTIYFEHLQKGVNKTMSTKDWKNGEINTLLTEKWGFKFDLSHLSENIEETGEIEEPVEEDCPAGGEMMVVGDEMPGDEGPEDTEGLAVELLAVAQKLADALGVSSEVGAFPGPGEEPMEEEPMEEGGLADRPENAARMPKDRGRRANEAQIRKMVREALKKIIVAKASQGK